jgi:mannose-1-phosphate guanylyltransferase
MAEVYAGIEPVSFDYGVMEKTTAPVFVVPCECGWSDVGSWESLYELRSGESDPAGNLALGEIELVDCRNLFVVSQPGRLVACLGMEDCLVVDTTDALLVAPRSRSQEVREIVDALKQKRKESFL